MFNRPKYIESAINIVFDRQSGIRRKANEFEDLLKGKYSQPDIISVPDDLDPEVPRMIFTSTHGYSRIIATQVNISLNVRYSEDEWQNNIDKGKEYMEERIPILFGLLAKLSPDVRVNYCGFNTRTRLLFSDSDKEFIGVLIKKYFNESISTEDLFELRLKKVKMIEQKYFSNIEISMYKKWNIEEIKKTKKFDTRNIAEKALDIFIDYNDKFAFNHTDNYISQESILKQVLRNALAELQKEIINASS
ncbi:MAG: Uncharacterized protein FD145_212 [Candidatus Saganbacteria bacterium]|uniref:TIGR04255 family protein n=1 Tax=Candidatus Saganbacteria bacterium TaxID=2575572 RepID=A0A833L277_UNCSA|nr:MAG: Uncharacterized protein FD145_212 [Candidatus Saganbacteria bacterium]